MKQNINEIMKMFLAERKKVLAPRTFGFYEEAVSLMRHCFNSYGHMVLDENQNKFLDEKYEQGIEYCDLFSAEVLEYSLFSEFLGYFLPRKVVIGNDSARKICGACLNFYRWLVVNKMIEDEEMRETIRDLRECFSFYWEESNKPFEESNYF